MALRLAVVCCLLASVTADATIAEQAAWLAHKFTISPIPIPGFPTGYPFPASFPFPVTYPLPSGFPYAPNVYETLLPSLIAQYNTVLAATSNNVAAAAAAAAAVAPQIVYTKPDSSVTHSIL